MNAARAVLFAMTLVAATLTFAADSRTTRDVYRIGWLSGGGGRPIDAEVQNAFTAGLTDLGWDRRRIEFVERWANQRYERVAQLAAALVAQNVDVIVAVGDGAAKAAMGVTRRIPIVFLSSWDPVGGGLVASLTRPGGNVTGVSNMAPEMYGKELALLKEAIPELRKVGIVIESETLSAPAVGNALLAACESLGIQPVVVPSLPLDTLDARLQVMSDQGVQAITGYVVAPVFQDRLVRLGTAKRIPLAGYTDAAPGLLSLETDEMQLIRGAARYVDRIKRGANPGELAVEQPTIFELLINLTTAKTYGIVIPQSLLLRADKLIR